MALAEGAVAAPTPMVETATARTATRRRRHRRDGAWTCIGPPGVRWLVFWEFMRVALCCYAQAGIPGCEGPLLTGRPAGTGAPARPLRPASARSARGRSSG